MNGVAEIEDEGAARVERVREELARRHIVLDVVGSSSARCGQRANDLPVGCRTAIDVDDRKKVINPFGATSGSLNTPAV